MRNNGEVQKRIRELLDEEFQRRVRISEERLPACCVYNYRHPLDSRKRVNGEENPQFNRIARGESLPVVQTIGLCMYGSDNPETWSGTICEDPIDAKRCPPQAFTPRTNREAIKKEFEGQIKDLGWVEINLPHVHALLWALGEEKPPVAPPPTPAIEELPPADESVPAVEVHEPTVHLSWWPKFLLWLAGLGRHKVLPPGDD
jgi:hypothetical protein